MEPYLITVLHISDRVHVNYFLDNTLLSCFSLTHQCICTTSFADSHCLVNHSLSCTDVFQTLLCVNWSTMLLYASAVAAVAHLSIISNSSSRCKLTPWMSLRSHLCQACLRWKSHRYTWHPVWDNHNKLISHYCSIAMFIVQMQWETTLLKVSCCTTWP